MVKKKLTLKEKSMEGFMLSIKLINFAQRLAQDAKDFGWTEAKYLAREMEDTGKEYRDKFKN